MYTSSHAKNIQKKTKNKQRQPTNNGSERLSNFKIEMKQWDCFQSCDVCVCVHTQMNEPETEHSINVRKCNK